MKKNRPEDKVQRACCQLLDIYERQGRLRYFAVPNGGKRSRIEASIMKGLGTKAGVPDLCVLIANGLTLFIEIKSDTGKVSKEQTDWLDWIKANKGHRYSAVCRDVGVFHAIIITALEAAK